MQLKIVRTSGLSILVLLVLVGGEAVLVSIFAGSGPNHVSVPLLEQFSLLRTLWHSNPAAALPLMTQTPVFVFAHQEPADSIQAWGLYYFPFTFVVHLAIAVVVASLLYRTSDHSHRLLWLTVGSTALAFSVSYTRFATCCTGGPRWVLDVALYALAFDPTPALLDWSVAYARTEALFPLMQFATGMAGIACILVAMRKQAMD